MKKKIIYSANKEQKAFLNLLLKSIAQAQSTKEAIEFTLTIGVADEAACLAYVQSLQQYINDAQRMAMQCNIAYGEGANTIAAEAVNNVCVN